MTSPTPPTWLELVLLLTGQGPSGGREEVRSWRDGARVRVEEMDGTPSFITDGTTTWTFSPGEPPSAAQGRSTIFSGRGTHLLARRTSRDALEGDLARTAGPASATTRLGRAAWEMELDLTVSGVHDRHPDGSFRASLSHHRASLARRPRSSAPWELGWYEEAAAHRWSTQGWDWAFHCTRER